MARIVVLGAGFAGLWAAIGAARKRDEIGAAGRDIEIRVVDRNPYHNIRVRNYEADLSEVALPLAATARSDRCHAWHRRGRSDRPGTARDFARHERRRGDAELRPPGAGARQRSDASRHPRPCRACFRCRYLCRRAQPRKSSRLARTQRAVAGALDCRGGRCRLHRHRGCGRNAGQAGARRHHRQSPHRPGRSQPCGRRHDRRACASRHRDGTGLARRRDAAWRARRVRRGRRHAPELGRVHPGANRDLVRRDAREPAGRELRGRARSPRPPAGRSLHAGGRCAGRLRRRRRRLERGRWTCTRP